MGVGSLVFHGTEFEPSQAWVVLESDGTARVVVGIADLGCGTETILAQIAAEELGLPVDQLAVVFGDTRSTPYTINASYGSRTAAVAGPAVRAAAGHARRQLLAVAARELREPAESLTVRDGAIVRASGERLPIREAARALGRDSILGVGRRHPAPDGVAVFAFGVHFAEVEVDADTGQVRVLRAVCAHDAGRFLNPLLAESQIQGGFIQGLGMALFEERIMDGRLGTMLNDSMLGYFVPTILDTPASLSALEAPTEDRSNSVGAKGLGEPPLVAAGAAIANAVFNALGVRVRSYPITPDKVLAALQARTT